MVWYPTQWRRGRGSPGGGAMAPPEKKLSDNFDTCRKFLVHICEI